MKFDAAPGPKMGPKSRRVGLFLFSIPIVTAFGLGFWQIYRLRWKQGVIRQIESSISAESKPVDDVVPLQGDRSAVQYSSVIAQGVFRHDNEILVGPRPPVDGGSQGYFVVTPLKLNLGSAYLSMCQNIVRADRL